VHQKNSSARFGNDEERKFEMQMAALGCWIKVMASDGNCMFRSIADQLEGEVSNQYVNICAILVVMVVVVSDGPYVMMVTQAVPIVMESTVTKLLILSRRIGRISSPSWRRTRSLMTTS